MKTLKIIICNFLCFYLIPSYGDILFVNLNMSPLERRAVERGAQARGEKVVILPNLAPVDRNKAEDLASKLIAIDVSLSKLKKSCPFITDSFENDDDAPSLTSYFTYACSSQKDYNLYEKLKAERDAIDVKWNDLRQKYKLDNTQLEETLSSQGLQGKFSSLVVSGHHTDVYSGKFGNINEKNLVSYLKNNPSFQSNLKSVYLWGCYSNTRRQAKKWHEALPAVQFIGGFDNKAPLGTNKLSSIVLESSLKKEKEIVAVASQSKKPDDVMKNLQSSIKKIEAINQVPSAFCVNDYYVTKKSASSIVAVRSCSPEIVKDIQQGHDLYLKYLKGEKDFEYVPESTSSSPLRKYYTLLRQNSDCKEVSQLADVEMERVIRLIFFNTVSENFAKYFLDTVSSINEYADDFGFDPVGFPGLINGKYSRADVLKFVAQIQDLVVKSKTSIAEKVQKTMLEKPKEKWRVDQLQEFSTSIKFFEGQATSMMRDFTAIPLSWLESEETPEDPLTPDNSFYYE